MSDGPHSVIPGMVPVPFTTRGGFQDAVTAALGAAQREIIVASAEFTGWPFNQPAVETHLRAFFRASRVNRVRLLTTGQHGLGQSAPRLARVAREFSHAFAVRLVADAVAEQFRRHWCLVMVDRARLVRRFHPDQMRGVAEFDPDEAEVRAERFEVLWNESTPGLAATTIGLSA